MAEVKITDPAYAVRFLEALVKRLEPWDDFEPLEGWACVLDGAKAILEEHEFIARVKRNRHLSEYGCGGYDRSSRHVVAFAQAVATHIDSVKMKVPT